MTTPLWRGVELAELFGQKDFSQDVTGVSIDTRTLAPGDLFIALSGDPGERFGGGISNARDGHDFIGQAVEAGAAAVLVHQDIDADVPTLRVADTLDGLWKLGRFARQRFQGKVVAVTGSSGKTTIRSWFEHVIAKAGSCHASVGSLNNHWGVPLSLARMPADRDFAILEVGTNHPGEIAPLSELVSPDVSLLLNVLPAHIGNFDNLDALTDEKLSISAGLPAGGQFVLPHRLRDRSSFLETVTFGNPDDANETDEQGVKPDITATWVSEDSGTSLTLSAAGHECTGFLPFHGRERVESTLALVATLYALGVDLDLVLPALRDLPLPSGRGNLQQVDGVVVVDDSYNANPGSMSMSLRSFSMQKSTRKFAFLGEMLELGKDGARYHQETAAGTAGLDHVFSFGQGFEHCEFAAPATHYESVSQFPLDGFVAGLQPGDAILVKGSNKVFWVNDFVQQLIRALGSR